MEPFRRTFGSTNSAEPGQNVPEWNAGNAMYKLAWAAGGWLKKVPFKFTLEFGLSAHSQPVRARGGAVAAIEDLLYHFYYPLYARSRPVSWNDFWSWC